MRSIIVALGVVPLMLACGSKPPTGSGGAGGSGGTAGSGGSAGSGGGQGASLPCDVEKVLKYNCQTCHGSPLAAGAPMPLLSYADTQATRNGRPVWQLMKDRVNMTGSAAMPPNAVLSDADKATLNSWFDGNAPGSGEVCQNTDPDPTCIGPDCLPCTPNVILTTYGGVEGSGTKFTVTPGQRYVDFKFSAPFKPGELAIATAPIIDNTSVIHHWILYGVDAAGTRTHVAGWAPGGQNSVLPDDIAQQLDYQSYVMQVHYYNMTGTDQLDASGVAFCTTTTPRAHTAGIFTLGTYSILIPPYAESTSVATCNVQRPMTIIGTSPHMHKAGNAFTTEHIRDGQTIQPLLSNIPAGEWRFDGQVHYPVLPRREVLVGDVLKSTCYYKNPTGNTITFGPNTENEMCFDFMMVYPYSSQMRSCNGGAAP